MGYQVGRLTEVSMADEKADQGDIDAEGRKAAASSLRRQIDNLVAGKTRPAQSSSLRDFIDQKMAEDQQEKKRSE
jgi:hypothetical protein